MEGGLYGEAKMLKVFYNNLLFKTIKDINTLLSPQEWKKGIGVIFFVLLGSIVDVLGVVALIPIMAMVMDSAIIHNNIYFSTLYEIGNFSSDNSFMMFMVLGLLFIFVIKNGIVLLVAYLQSTYSYNVAANLSRRQFIKYYQKGFQFINEKNSAEIVNNVIAMSSFFSHGILLATISFFSEFFVLSFIVIGILYYNVVLFISMLCVLIPSFFIIFYLSKNKLHSLGEFRDTLSAQTLAYLQQAIFGYVDIKLTNKEFFFLHSYLDKQKHLNNTQKNLYVFNLLPTRFIELIAILGVVVIFVYVTVNDEDRESLLFFLSLFVAAAFRVMPSMGRIIGSVMQIKSHQSTILKLKSDGMPVVSHFRIDIKQVIFNHSIEFKNISFQYSAVATEAIKNFSFKINKGEKIGIIGSSGSGKTTLVNILLRFLIEDHGALLIDGHKLNIEDSAGWRSRIGYVQQEVYLLDGSLKENIAFGEEPETVNMEKLNKVVEQASLKLVVENLPQGLDTNVGERGAKLSGGQRQRIGIARALYKGADVLVFDEATSALDMETEREITEAIDNLAGMSKTIFIIAHRITTLKNCERIIELKEGKLIAAHNYRQLIAERIKSE